MKNIKNLKLFVMPVYLFLLFCPSYLPAQEQKLPQIIKKIVPSTVIIFTYDENGEIIGQGSGFFVSSKGDIITNRHVFFDASSAEVKTAAGQVYAITQIVAENKEADIIRALVDVKKPVRSLSLSNSISEAGERIAVIGNPLGLEKTVSDGIVSAVREIPGFGRIYQITAPISPGSSGGPVINMEGELIGVATFQLIEGQNLNFVIASEHIANLKVEKGKSFKMWAAENEEEGRASAEEIFSVGLVFLWMDDYETALPYFEKAVEKNTSHAGAYFYIGYCNNKLVRYQDAIEAFKQTIRINPDYVDVHYNLGVVYRKLGHHQEALESFKQAIRINPDLVEAHLNIGVIYGDLGRYQDAIEACKQAIRINPDDDRVHYNLGVTYTDLGRYQEAVEAYKQAIRINPDDVNVYYNLGVAYRNLSRYQEAVEAYKQAIRINPDDAEVHLNLGVAYGELGRYQDAIEAYKQAIRINPDYAGAHYNCGRAYLIVQDKSSALAEYKVLKELDKNLANELFNLIYE